MVLLPRMTAAQAPIGTDGPTQTDIIAESIHADKNVVRQFVLRAL